jgi:hypothetical protein
VYLSAAGVRGDSGNASMRARGLPIARPSFITGPDRDESRPLERVSAAVNDVMLATLSSPGASRLRDRYRSTDNTILAAALVRLAPDHVCESEDLRDRTGSKSS